jgi:hypothetical protein
MRPGLQLMQPEQFFITSMVPAQCEHFAVLSRPRQFLTSTSRTTTAKTHVRGLQCRQVSLSLPPMHVDLLDVDKVAAATAAAVEALKWPRSQKVSDRVGPDCRRAMIGRAGGRRRSTQCVAGEVRVGGIGASKLATWGGGREGMWNNMCAEI